MSSKKPGKRFLGAQESIDRHLAQLDMDVRARERATWVHCRAPSCNKAVQQQYTRNGYCLACVKKAAKIKEQREQRAVERERRELQEELELALEVGKQDFGAF